MLLSKYWEYYFACCLNETTAYYMLFFDKENTINLNEKSFKDFHQNKNLNIELCWSRIFNSIYIGLIFFSYLKTTGDSFIQKMSQYYL